MIKIFDTDLNTDLTLGDCLFGTVKFKNADPDKHKNFILGIDNSSSVYANNRKKVC